MIELLVPLTLGVNFETKTRLAREWVCSRPKQVLDFMPLFSVVKTDFADNYIDFHFGCISWKASKHNRQHCIQKCNMISGNTQRLQGWGTLGSGNDQLRHSKQAVKCSHGFLINLHRVLDSVAVSSCPENVQVHRHPTAREIKFL